MPEEIITRARLKALYEECSLLAGNAHPHSRIWRDLEYAAVHAHNLLAAEELEAREESDTPRYADCRGTSLKIGDRVRRVDAPGAEITFTIAEFSSAISRQKFSEVPYANSGWSIPGIGGSRWSVPLSKLEKVG